MKLVVNLKKGTTREQGTDNIIVLKRDIEKAISGDDGGELKVPVSKLYSPHSVPALSLTEDMIDNEGVERLDEIYEKVCGRLQIPLEKKIEKSFEKSLGSDYLEKFEDEYGIELSDNATREQAQALWDALKNIPKNFLEGKVERICLDERMGRSKRYYPNHGKYIEEEKKVMINPTVFNSKEKFEDDQGHSMSKVAQVIVHELSHGIDDANGFSDEEEWREISDWKKIGEDEKPPKGYKRLTIKEEGTPTLVSPWVFKADTEFPRWYAARNPKEDFAESCCFALAGLVGRFHGDTGKAKYEFIKKHVLDNPELVKSLKGSVKPLHKYIRKEQKGSETRYFYKDDKGREYFTHTDPEQRVPRKMQTFRACFPHEHLVGKHDSDLNIQAETQREARIFFAKNHDLDYLNAQGFIRAEKIEDNPAEFQTVAVQKDWSKEYKESPEFEYQDKNQEELAHAKDAYDNQFKEGSRVSQNQKYAFKRLDFAKPAAVAEEKVLATVSKYQARIDLIADMKKEFEFSPDGVFTSQGYGYGNTYKDKNGVSIVLTAKTRDLDTDEFFDDSFAAEEEKTPPHVLYIERVTSKEKGKGNASATFKKLLGLADKHGIELRLVPQPYGREKGKLNLKQLTDWYTKYGFTDKQGKYLKRPAQTLTKALVGTEVPFHKYIRREGHSGEYKYYYQEPTAKEMPIEDARNYIETYTHYRSGDKYYQRTIWANWFLSEDRNTKHLVVDEIRKDPKLEYAMQSVFYFEYKKQHPDYKKSFQDFLEDDVTIYRGKRSYERMNIPHADFVSFSTSKDTAEYYSMTAPWVLRERDKEDPFSIEELKIKPKNTYGAVDYVYGKGGEVEVLVPAPASTKAIDEYREQAWYDDSRRAELEEASKTPVAVEGQHQGEVNEFNPQHPPNEEKLWAIKLTDGRIFYGKDYKMHADLIDAVHQRMLIPIDNVEDGGWIKNGVFTMGSSDAKRIGDEARAREFVRDTMVEAAKVSKSFGEDMEKSFGDERFPHKYLYKKGTGTSARYYYKDAKGKVFFTKKKQTDLTGATKVATAAPSIKGISTPEDKHLHGMLDSMAKGLGQLMGERNKDRRFPCSEAQVLGQGRFFKAQPLPREYKRGEMKACYMNAAKLALDNPELTYVEGYGTTKKIQFLPFAHAWCVDKHGNVIDPTWTDGVAYCGVPVTTDFLRRQLLATKMYGILSGAGVNRFVKEGIPDKDIVKVDDSKPDINKSIDALEEFMLEKATYINLNPSPLKGRMVAGSKYLRREGEPGRYKYWYVNDDRELFSLDYPIHFEQARPRYGVDYAEKKNEQPWERLMSVRDWEDLKAYYGLHEYPEYKNKKIHLEAMKERHFVWLYRTKVGEEYENFYYDKVNNEIKSTNRMYSDPDRHVPVFGGLLKGAPDIGMEQMKELQGVINKDPADFAEVYDEYVEKQKVFLAGSDKSVAELTKDEYDNMPINKKTFMNFVPLDYKDVDRAKVIYYANPLTGKIVSTTTADKDAPWEKPRFPLLRGTDWTQFLKAGRVPLDYLYERIYEEKTLQRMEGDAWSDMAQKTAERKYYGVDQPAFESELSEMPTKADRFAHEERKINEGLAAGGITPKDIVQNVSTGQNLVIKTHVPNDGFVAMKIEALEPASPSKSVETGGQTKRELFAYQFDHEILGFNIIPPTIATTVNKEVSDFLVENFNAPKTEGSKASLQAWVFGKIGKDLTLASQKDIQAMTIFDYLTNQVDRHSGNYKVDKGSGLLYGIDNGMLLGFNDWYGHSTFNELKEKKVDPEVQRHMRDVAEAGNAIRNLLEKNGFDNEQVKHYSTLITERAAIIARTGRIPVDSFEEITFMDATSPKLREVGEWVEKKFNHVDDSYKNFKHKLNISQITPHLSYKDFITHGGTGSGKDSSQTPTSSSGSGIVKKSIESLEQELLEGEDK